MAAKIVDWGSLPSHVTFYAAIYEKHKLKYSFWELL